MAGTSMNTTAGAELIRSNLWSTELKEVLQDEMMAQNIVRLLSDFPDGDTLNIPTINPAAVSNYVEDTEVTYAALGTDNFTFTIDQYLQSPHYITKKQMQDSYVAAQLQAAFVPAQRRAIMEHYEATTFAAPEVGVAADSGEAIDGIKHRVAGGGTGGRMALEDFAYARYALKKAKVADNGLVAIVDPSVEYQLNTLTNLVNVSNNPRFEGIVSEGIATGMRFVANVYGFDVYTSNYLKTDVTTTVAFEDKEGTGVAITNGAANLFFSVDATSNPFVGAWRQMPEVDYEYNKDFQRHEYLTTARYGVKKYRPEGIVTVVSNRDL